jgi:octaprenyl-diphosphate synthase
MAASTAHSSPFPSTREAIEAMYVHLESDLARVREVLARTHKVHGKLMQEVAAYVADGEGKLLRPCMLCLSARACGLDTASTDHHINLAAAIELFHVATLLHDDVIDKATLRRGRQTVNDRWGDDVAILYADYLYATVFDLGLSTLNPQTIRILTSTTRLMTEGEFLQIERRGDWLPVEDYLKIIKYKTGYLFSAASGLGALIAGADSDTIERMRKFGVEFGMAFQITDDTLDYEAQGDQWGKRVGADLAEGKQTLPLLQTLAVASHADREALVKVLENGRDFNTVQTYVRKYRAIEHSLETAAAHAARAMEQLDALGTDDPSAEFLRSLTQHVTARTH